MAGPQDKRKPFKGKKLHKDLREFKNQEIKRSLVHRARLRKNYFKLLEQNNEPVPESHQTSEDELSDGQKHSQEVGSGSESTDGEQEENVSAKRSKPLPPQRPPPVEKKKPMDFAQRAKLAKERKEKSREEKLKRVQERRQLLERKNLERQRKKDSLNQRTKTGQPVMGPKINDLLSKIKQNSQ